MKAYSSAELVVSLAIVFALLIASVSAFKTGAANSTFKADQNTISSKLNEAGIKARSSKDSQTIVKIVDRQIVIFKRLEDGEEVQDDPNPLFLKSDSVEFDKKIIFNNPSAELEESVKVKLKKDKKILNFTINKFGVIDEI